MVTSSEKLIDPAKSVLGSIRAQLPSLPRGDRKVAEKILEDPSGVIHLTVGELAQRAGTAESTVVRCSRKLGYRGYQDLKIHLARETADGHSNVAMTLSSDASSFDALRTVLAIEAEVLADISSSIDRDSFERAVDYLHDAGRILLIGFGSSSIVCQEAEHRLLSIGLDVSAPEAQNHMLLASTRMRPGDVMLCVSHTGATTEILRLAEHARQHDARVVAISSFARTPLARVADVALVAGGRDLDFSFGALSGRTAHLVVLDALYAALALRRPEQASKSLADFNDAEASWRL